MFYLFARRGGFLTSSHYNIYFTTTTIYNVFFLNFISCVHFLPSSVVYCCPVLSMSPSSPSTLSTGSRCGLAADLYTTGSISPFWRPLWETLSGGTRWGPPWGGPLYVMALLSLSPKACFPGDTPTFFCFWLCPDPPPPIPKTDPTLTPTAGPKVLFFFRASERALELSVAGWWLVKVDSWRFLETLGLLCECSLRLLNWSMNSSQCRRWCSGSHVSSLLP